MRAVFADTLYWYGLANPRDQWHPVVLQARARLGPVLIVTTEEVLTEFLTAMSGGGEHLRRTAATLVQTILADESTKVLPQTHFSFLRGLELYEQRADKAYSLVDCISMNSMRDEGLTAILANDHHFTQEGFTILLHK
jgi:predicted nucleic acid-binding protein